MYYEEGKTKFDLKDLKEAATVEVEGAAEKRGACTEWF